MAESVVMSFITSLLVSERNLNLVNISGSNEVMKLDGLLGRLDLPCPIHP